MILIANESESKAYERAISVSVSRSAQNFVGQFSATMAIDEDGSVPFTLGDTVVLYVNNRDTPLLTGYVEETEVFSTADERLITIQGRDLTADVLDSSLFETSYPVASGSFVDLVRQVLNTPGQGLNGISVNTDDLTGSTDLSNPQRVVGENGQGVFDFLDTYAREVGVVIGSNESGELTIFRSGSRRSGLRMISKLRDDGTSNILESVKKTNTHERFGRYRVAYQLPSTDENDQSTPEQQANPLVSAEVGGLGIRASRFKEIVAETAMDATAAQRRAQLESKVDLTQSETYSATIQGIHPEARPLASHHLLLRFTLS